MRLPLTVLSLFLLLASPLMAGDITLDADDKVEYFSSEQKLVATGNAVASKDGLKIKASKLTGFYNPAVKNKISRIEAQGNVELSTPQAEAFGDSLIYSAETDTATLKGNPARIKTPDADITAKGAVTYYQTEQKAVASDGVVASDAKGNKIFADLMTAWFAKDASNKLVLDKIDIEQNLRIIGNDAEVTALRGTYYAQSGTIKLFDDVVISQNGNILKGDTAETNLNTGISKILSGGKSGRVSGVFKEKKKKD